VAASLHKLPNISGYSRLHRFRSVARLLKSGAKNPKNALFFDGSGVHDASGAIFIDVSKTG